MHQKIFNTVYILVLVMLMWSCKNDTSDYQAPSLKLYGDVVINLSLNETYNEPGYLAFDDVDGILTDRVWAETDLNTNRSGKYGILYNVKDAAGNWAVSAIRTVIIKNDAKPLAKTYRGEYSNVNGDSGGYDMTLRVSPTENKIVRFSSFGDAPVNERVDVVGNVVGDSIVVELQQIDSYWYSGKGVVDGESIRFQSYTGTDVNQMVESQVAYVPLDL